MLLTRTSAAALRLSRWNGLKSVQQWQLVRPVSEPARHLSLCLASAQACWSGVSLHERVCFELCQLVQKRYCCAVYARYLDIAGGGSVIKQRSMLLFAWHVRFSDGTGEMKRVQVRADNLKARGVPRPARLSTACEKKSRYTSAGAAALAEAATREAEGIIGQGCVSVACECASVIRLLIRSNTT